MNENEYSPYPLEHWASRMQEIPPAISEAIAVANQTKDQPTHPALESGATIKPLSGAGNHRVLGLHFEGKSYCLKQPTPSKRHQGNPEQVLRREVGGMCMLNDQVPNICPLVDFEYCGWNDMPLDLSMVTEHIRSYETPIEVLIRTYTDERPFAVMGVVPSITNRLMFRRV